MNDEMLQRYIEGRSSQQEKEIVARWLLADEENKRKYLLMRRVYDASLMFDIEEQKTKTKQASHRFIYEALKIAAVFLIVLGLNHFLFTKKQQPQQQPVAMQRIHVPEGQRAEITLADGTEVWLNANTDLSFPTQFSDTERKVELNGEAYFKVIHDESKKFIVQTEQYQVNVLGTEFNVKAYRQDHQFETALLKGSVEIASSLTGEKIRLTPEQRLYTENGRLMQASLANHDKLLWKDGIIAFENESMSAIFDQLQLYYDVRIEVQNRKIPADTFTGKFRTKDGVGQVLMVLRLRHNFLYLKTNDSNTIVIY
jgi:ferric-dicitrate binding protein FerR (iron transport regulator)